MGGRTIKLIVIIAMKDKINCEKEKSGRGV